jgi:hypothetical protein
MRAGSRAFGIESKSSQQAPPKSSSIEVQKHATQYSSENRLYSTWLEQPAELRHDKIKYIHRFLRTEGPTLS